MLARKRGHGFRRRPLSMTSLIDVIFLLLLFFMLSSTFSKFADIELLGAGAGPADGMVRTPVFIRLTPDGLSLNGRAQTLDGLPEALKPLSATSSDTAEIDGEASDRMVLVSLDDAVTSQRLVDLLAVLRPVNGIRVQVLGGG